MDGDYLVVMAPPLEVRKANFARWVQRVLAQAQDQRGLSVPTIAKMAGIGDQTIYRWRNGTLKKLPFPEQVVAFCDALDITTKFPFLILWPGKNDEAAEPEPIVLDSNYQALQRKLQDPAVPEFEKLFIQESLRQLADRPSNPAHLPQRKRPTKKS